MRSSGAAIVIDSDRIFDAARSGADLRRADQALRDNVTPKVRNASMAAAP